MVWLLLFSLHFSVTFSSPSSAFKSPLVKNNDFLPSNKFTQRPPLQNVKYGVDASGLHINKECPMSVSLVWMNELDSSIYATPVIDRFQTYTYNSLSTSSGSSVSSGGGGNIESDKRRGREQKKHIIIPQFHNKVSILDQDGHFTRNSPIEMTVKESDFHTSPIIADVNDDGYNDIVYVSFDGEVCMINGKNSSVSIIFVLPKLRVRKKWYEEEHEEDKNNNNRNHFVQFSHIDEKETAANKKETEKEEIKKFEQRHLLEIINQNDEDLFIQPQDEDEEDDKEISSSSRMQQQKRTQQQQITRTQQEHTQQQKRAQPTGSEFVEVDAHVLATPVAVDVNNDGSLELIICVSYFFDREMYTNYPERFQHIESDVDFEMYVAGGIVVYDIRRHAIVWSEKLDLTTDLTELRAHIYSPPTVLDVDRDGELEICLGTSMGSIYMLSAVTGEIHSGFPLYMSEIQAQISSEDINGDGEIEFIATDVKGNVLCFDKTGKEIWETQIQGFITQHASFGDINGDKEIDIVVATLSGYVYALEGKTGKILPFFPLKTDDRILAPVTLVNLHTEKEIRERQLAIAKKTVQHVMSGSSSMLFPGGGALREIMKKEEEERAGRGRQDEESNSSSSSSSSSFASSFYRGSGLHLVFPSFDGHVYIVDGRTGCTNKLDISEQAYGMVLADDLLDNGKMSLLVTTQNGNVYYFATESPYHPLKTWSSQTQGINVFSARQNFHGIYIVEYPKIDIVGFAFDLTFEIVDERPKMSKNNRYNNNSNINNDNKVKYTVTIGLSGIDPSETTQDAFSRLTNRQSIFRKIYMKPGRYTERINCPHKPHHAVLHLHMWNEHLQYFQDSAPMSFNVHYYRILKYLIIVPLLVGAGLFAVLYQPNRHEVLPHRDHFS